MRCVCEIRLTTTVPLGTTGRLGLMLGDGDRCASAGSGGDAGFSAQFTTQRDVPSAVAAVLRTPTIYADSSAMVLAYQAGQPCLFTHPHKNAPRARYF